MAEEIAKHGAVHSAGSDSLWEARNYAIVTDTAYMTGIMLCTIKSTILHMLENDLRKKAVQLHLIGG